MPSVQPRTDLPPAPHGAYRAIFRLYARERSEKLKGARDALLIALLRDDRANGELALPLRFRKGEFPATRDRRRPNSDTRGMCLSARPPMAISERL